jgi:hypothetical protein
MSLTKKTQTENKKAPSKRGLLAQRRITSPLSGSITDL